MRGSSRIVSAIDASVSGREPSSVEAALDDLGFAFVHNAHWRDGLGGSIASGVKALPEDIDAAFIVPGDMPFLTKKVFEILAGVFQHSETDAPIVFPMLDGHVQTNPVLWPRRLFGALAQLSGPAGAKSLLVRHAGDTRGIAFDDPHIFRDIDTQADLEAARVFASS